MTVAHYDALQGRLKALYPNRDSEEYVAIDSVLTTKLEILHSQIPLKSSTAPSGSQLDYHEDQELRVKDDEALEYRGVVDEARSFFPTNIEFLDLSSLGLQNIPERLPVPLLMRQEYHSLSKIIQDLPRDSRGGVMISGQPGIGQDVFISVFQSDQLLKARPPSFILKLLSS